MDLDMELHNAGSSSHAARRKRKKRNGKSNALCNSNDSSHDHPEGASLIQDIPLERNSCVESTVDISCNSGLVEAQSNCNLMCLRNKKKRKREGKKSCTDNTNVGSKNDCPYEASLMQDIPLERNSCAEPTVDIWSNSCLIELHSNSNSTCSQNKKKRKRQRKKEHNAPKPDNADIDLQEVPSKTASAPFRTESSVDMINKTVLETAPLGKEALGDTCLKIQLAATPMEMNASVEMSTKTDSTKKLSRSQKKRMRRKRRKESQNALEHDDKDHYLPGENSLRKNILEKDSSFHLSVDICSKNELVMKQPNGDLCLFNGHKMSLNNGVVNLQIANGKHLETGDRKLVPQVAELDLSTVKEDFLMSEKQISSSKSENRSLMEKHDVPTGNDLVSSEVKNIITYKRKNRVKTYIRKKKKKCSDSSVNSLDCIEEDGTRHISEHRLMKDVSVLPEGHLEWKDREKLDEIQITVQDASHGDGVSDEILSNPKESNRSSHDACCKHPKKNTVEVETKMAEIYPSSHLGVVNASGVLDGTGKKESLPQTLQSSAERVCTGRSKKKLLVLDVNGLLADIVSRPSHIKPDIMVSKKAVYKRPYCDDFLQFCFERFNVGIWSSRVGKNLDKVIDVLMGDSRQNLLFCWDQTHCSTTGLNTIENSRKPLVLKELKKLWKKVEPNLPWKTGEYNETNTLLLDDSPYKALCNPAYTAVFPYPYDNRDTKDFSLGPGGDLRVYLEGLAVAENVQEYVRQNPFGQRAITESNPYWDFYKKVFHRIPRPPLYKVKNKVIYSTSCKQCD